MPINRTSSGIYTVSLYGHNQEFPSIKRALRFVRYMGCTPEVCL